MSESRPSNSEAYLPNSADLERWEALRFGLGTDVDKAQHEQAIDELPGYMDAWSLWQDLVRAAVQDGRVELKADLQRLEADLCQAEHAKRASDAAAKSGPSMALLDQRQSLEWWRRTRIPLTAIAAVLLLVAGLWWVVSEIQPHKNAAIADTEWASYYQIDPGPPRWMNANQSSTVEPWALAIAAYHDHAYLTAAKALEALAQSSSYSMNRRDSAWYYAGHAHAAMAQWVQACDSWQNVSSASGLYIYAQWHVGLGSAIKNDAETLCSVLSRLSDVTLSPRMGEIRQAMTKVADCP